MGISLAIIGKTLGHADLKSTQVYARFAIGPREQAVAQRRMRCSNPRASR